MAANEQVSADAVGSAKAKETLSQFVARIFDQLTLSAWLPAGALVLLSTFVLQLGSAVRVTQPVPSVVEALRKSASSIGSISLGGGLILLAAVVLLTMITQAFAFEAIRVLEGYWGTNRVLEWFADRRCNHFRRKLEHLDGREQQIKKDIWSWIETGLANQRKTHLKKNYPIEITEDMQLILEAQFKGALPHRTPTEEESAILDCFVDSGEWELFAQPSLIPGLLVWGGGSLVA